MLSSPLSFIHVSRFDFVDIFFCVYLKTVYNWNRYRMKVVNIFACILFLGPFRQKVVLKLVQNYLLFVFSYWALDGYSFLFLSLSSFLVNRFHFFYLIFIIQCTLCWINRVLEIRKKKHIIILFMLNNKNQKKERRWEKNSHTIVCELTRSCSHFMLLKKKNTKFSCRILD